jgi:DNA-binding MarR family transcriptional regulator
LALKPLDVSPAGGLVLGILKDAGQPCPPNYISERLIVSRTTVTGVLDTLVKRGLVRREPHPTDRRMVLVHLRKLALAWPTRFAGRCIVARRSGWAH